MRDFSNDECGAAAIEYAILIACIALLVLGAVMLLSDDIQGGWSLASEMLSS